MAHLLLTTVDGAEIGIETEPSPGAFQQTGKSGVEQRAEEAFHRAIASVTHISREFMRAIAEMGDEGPDSFELSFGVKFAATGDVWVAKATTEAQLIAKVGWRRGE